MANNMITYLYHYTSLEIFSSFEIRACFVLVICAELVITRFWFETSLCRGSTTLGHIVKPLFGFCWRYPIIVLLWVPPVVIIHQRVANIPLRFPPTHALGHAIAPQ